MMTIVDEAQRLMRENAALREALRRHAITTYPNNRWHCCAECKTDWAGDVEAHKTGCLAGDKT